jgi:hypothetical protein
MLDRNRDLWKGHAAHFYADSGSSAGVYLNAIHAEGWNYSVSYNKWISPLERKALELPAAEWVQHGGQIPCPHASSARGTEGSPQLYAVSRWKDDLFERFGFIACNDGVSDAHRLGQRHHLKEEEQLFGEVLSGLDLHRPRVQP